MDQHRSTWALREALEKKLKAIKWEREPLALCDDSIRKADDVSLSVWMSLWMYGCADANDKRRTRGADWVYHLHTYV